VKVSLCAGVRWFESKKDEKKKKAVDDFFQQILQLPVAHDAVSNFIDAKTNANDTFRKIEDDRPSTIEGQYEDINDFGPRSQQVFQSPDTNKQDVDARLYSPVVKSSTSLKSKAAPVPIPDNESTEIEPYEEIPATFRQKSGSKSESLPPQLLPTPEVPPKIGISPLSDDNAETTSQNTGDMEEGSVTPIASLKSIPPMPSFAPPPLQSPSDSFDSIESIGDQTDVHIVSVADFSSNSDNVLSFQRGNLASLVVGTDSKWWCIRLGHQYGWVPADYWRKLNPDSDVASLSSKSGAPWFVGKLTRSECEDLLMEHGKQQFFVVRESTNLVGHYALSVKYNDRVHHFPIELTPDKKYYIGKHHFKTVNSVISYYKKNALFFDENMQGVTLGNPLVVVKQ
jgi:hypothetical protein